MEWLQNSSNHSFQSKVCRIWKVLLMKIYPVKAIQITSTKTRPQKVLITTGEQLKIRNPRETPVDVKAITNFALPKGRSSDWCWLSIYLFVYRVDCSCVRNIKPRCKVNVSSWGEPLHIDFLRQISFWQTGLIFG